MNKILVAGVLVHLASPALAGPFSHLDLGKWFHSRPVKEKVEKPSFADCQKHVAELVNGLKCEIPKERKLPPKVRAELGEYALQMAAKTQKIDYAKLNALVEHTASEEGRKKLVGYFSGLACAGLEGDPLTRKNWRDYLPKCPNTAPSAAPWVSDPGPAIRKFHPGADSCWRKPADRPAGCEASRAIWECIGGEWLKEQPPAIAEILKAHPPAQQCCYGKSGVLIPSGPAAGTPDTVYAARVVEDVITDLGDEEEPPPAKDPASTLVARGREKILALQNRLKDGKSALEHNILDARLISCCMKDWPGEKDRHVETYHRLGWGPAVP